MLRAVSAITSIAVVVIIEVKLRIGNGGRNRLYRMLMILMMLVMMMGRRSMNTGIHHGWIGICREIGFNGSYRCRGCMYPVKGWTRLKSNRITGKSYGWRVEMIIDQVRLVTGEDVVIAAVNIDSILEMA